MLISVLLAIALGTTQQDIGQMNNSISFDKGDRCNYAKVYHLNVGSYLSVRSGPGESYPRIDRLEAGRSVYICDEHEEWYRIFYGGLDSPCGAESTGGLDVRNLGSCKSGWVNRKWINVISG